MKYRVTVSLVQMPEKYDNAKYRAKSVTSRNEFQNRQNKTLAMNAIIMNKLQIF